MKITDFIPVRTHSEKMCKIAVVGVPAGPPQNIADELEEFDLNEYLTGGEPGTFWARADGDSMEAPIYDGDWMFVNCNLQPCCGDTVIACVDGEYTVKIFKPSRNGLKLVPANHKYESRFVKWDDDWTIFGVVTGFYRRVKKI